MATRKLDHLELLSIAEKDEQYFRNWIGDDIHELAQRILGVRRWIQYKSAITFLARFSYFGLTSLRKTPTLGEEYCEAEVQAPSFIRNLSMILLNNELRLPPNVPPFYSSLFKDIHLVTFFLFGDFFELAKRVTNFSYTTIDSNTYQSKKIYYLYRLIGFISLTKLALNLSRKSENSDQTTKTEHVKEGDLQVQPIDKGIKTRFDSTMTCHLCSEKRAEPTSTICGHIFCWYCIHRWLKERSECPICRTPTEPSRLIHLINFR